MQLIVLFLIVGILVACDDKIQKDTSSKDSVEHVVIPVFSTPNYEKGLPFGLKGRPVGYIKEEDNVDNQIDLTQYYRNGIDLSEPFSANVGILFLNPGSNLLNVRVTDFDFEKYGCFKDPEKAGAVNNLDYTTIEDNNGMLEYVMEYSDRYPEHLLRANQILTQCIPKYDSYGRVIGYNVSNFAKTTFLPSLTVYLSGGKLNFVVTGSSALAVDDKMFRRSGVEVVLKKDGDLDNLMMGDQPAVPILNVDPSYANNYEQFYINRANQNTLFQVEKFLYSSNLESSGGKLCNSDFVVVANTKAVFGVLMDKFGLLNNGNGIQLKSMGDGNVYTATSYDAQGCFVLDTAGESVESGSIEYVFGVTPAHQDGVTLRSSDYPKTKGKNISFTIKQDDLNSEIMVQSHEVAHQFSGSKNHVEDDNEDNKKNVVNLKFGKLWSGNLSKSILRKNAVDNERRLTYFEWEMLLPNGSIEPHIQSTQ